MDNRDQLFFDLGVSSDGPPAKKKRAGKKKAVSSKKSEVSPDIGKKESPGDEAPSPEGPAAKKKSPRGRKPKKKSATSSTPAKKAPMPPAEPVVPHADTQAFIRELVQFDAFGTHTVTLERKSAGQTVPVFVNEFWTAGQRQANALHEISYRACFKPQLPRFFIERLTQPGDVVYDPFMGRGTTPLEAALLGRIPMGCDINPLSRWLTEPRLHPPSLRALEQRLRSLPLDEPVLMPEELRHFYHPEVLTQLCNLRLYLLNRRQEDTDDALDHWIQMVATNRLTGHSPGFFSVYTLPPNQAVSVKSQIKINEKRGQTPPKRDVIAIILKKSRSLIKHVPASLQKQLADLAPRTLWLSQSCDHTPEIPDDSVNLVVTSPPFLNVVDYATDNWLRGWFNGINPETVSRWQVRKPAEWQAKMTLVLTELHRILKRGGHVAFEVGEVLQGTVNLEDHVIPAGQDAGLKPQLVLINDQQFTKTANCWGVSNQKAGTNTNRIVVFQKDS